MTKEAKNNWFDTIFYHTLYKDRDEVDAQFFMKNLMNKLQISKKCKILDLACGRGRHSRYLHTLGYNVHGVDISNNSIIYAKKYESEGLKFSVQDMRNLSTNTTYDVILNLFTSFGYFYDDIDDIKVLQSIALNLENKGIAIIDYMNIYQVIKNLVPSEEKEIEGITFFLKRRLEERFICKDIHFTYKRKVYFYQEKVKKIDLQKFQTLLDTTPLTIKEIYGDYQLNDFDVATSPRLILILSK